MKKKILIIIGIIIILCGALFLIFFNRSDSKIKNIEKFKYSAWGGSTYGPEYNIDCNEECILTGFGYDSNNQNDGASAYKLSKSEMNKLISILNKYKVYNWAGFNESDDNITDGGGFTIYIKTDTDTIEATGYMKYPKNYDKFKKEIEKLFDYVK